VRVPEHLIVLADMACGAQAHFLFSAVTGGVSANQALLYGSRGTLRFSGGALWGRQQDDDRFHEIPIPPEERGGWRVEAEFVDAIRGLDTISHTTFLDGLKYMAFTEAVAKSMAENRTIALMPMAGC
jgi:predicted dehydrogenase